MINFIDAIPETPVFINCEKHGEFKQGYIPYKDRFMTKDNCSKCAEDKRIAKEAQEESDRLESINLRRQSKRINAGISKRNLNKNFDDYICSSDGQLKAKSDCVRFVETFPSDKSLIMVGGVGTGKTLLASAMIENLVDKHKCKIEKLIDIIRSVKATWSRDCEYTEESVLEYYIGLDLLIIDEVGSQFGSDTEKLFIFDVIDGRYQDMKQTVLISNLAIEGVKEAIGERCVDRLREGGGSMIAFNWSSARV